MKDYTDKNQPVHKRRDFIKLGTAGLVGSLTACATPGPQQQVDSSTPPAVPDRGLSETEPVPPDAGDVVRPESLPAETWQEPWTWRPEEWPEDSLELNVVGNQSPGSSPSPGNPNPALFSYNGISPGPTVRVRNDGELKIRVRD